MALYDTHAHLCDPSFDTDLEAVLARAREAGVSAVVAVSENVEEGQRTLELAAAHAHMVRPAVGHFPTILELEKAEQVIDLIRRQSHRLVAIGEVGLDYWKIKEAEERELQREIFGLFVELSLELDLPLNVHSRSAGGQTVDFLLERGARKVQLHAFDGRASKAFPGAEAGFYFSVPPSIVRSPQKRKLIRRLPLSCLLLETDSPVLAAEPSERNEPANVKVALEAICSEKGLDREEVESVLEENTLRLYGDLSGAP